MLARPAALFATLLLVDTPPFRPLYALAVAMIALCALPAGAAGQGPTPPAPVSLNGTWEIADMPAPPAATQPVPPDEDGRRQGA
nr:hypothetical protein [Thermoleophilaceae bacterium]